jgi:porin
MIADGNPNFYSWSGNVALQAGGLVPGRNLDTMGIGYFYDGLSSDFKDLVSPIVALEDVHGGELYYNTAFTPWFHVTTDLQVIDNQNQNQDTVIAVGLRANIDL